MASEPHRIDVHHHVVPADYVAALASIGISDAGGRPFPTWDVESTLAFMDRNGIATAIISISSPGVYFGDLGFAKDLARRCNEHLARLVNDHPQRFGALAVLPLPDINAALLETEYVLDTLHLNGVGLLASIGNRYLGDPSRILFGSDYAFAPEPLTAATVAGLRAYDGFDEPMRSAIDRDNSLALFPRLGRP